MLKSDSSTGELIPVELVGMFIIIAGVSAVDVTSVDVVSDGASVVIADVLDVTSAAIANIPDVVPGVVSAIVTIVGVVDDAP